MGNYGFGNFRAGNYAWDKLGKQWETMALVTLGLGMTTDRLGKPWETLDLVTFGLGITTGTGWGGHTSTHALYIFTCTYAC